MTTTARGLPKAALERVRDALAPGGQVLRARPLRGGISSKVHLVSLQAADGRREAVVVRRYGEYWLRVDPAACEREYRLLGKLAEHDFPAPRPLLLDAAGGPFGAPTVVMSRLPGRPLLAPRDLASFLKQLAERLADLHAIPTDGLDFLPDQQALMDRSLGREREPEDPLERGVLAAARHAWATVRERPTPKALVHGDYWPGNILFVRGRLTGIVDWEQPRLGAAEKDVATCRGDLAVLFGLDAADDFTAHYTRAAGRELRDMRFWDLMICTWAVPEVPEWAVAYRVLRRPDLTTAVATERMRRFAERALG